MNLIRFNKQKNERQKISLLSLLMTLVILLSSVSGSSIYANKPEYEAPMTLARSIDLNKVSYDKMGGLANQVTLDYSITPEPIPIGDVIVESVPKEVVVIIDKSGSMKLDVNGSDSSTSRMDLVKDAADTFVQKLGAVDNMSIGLVEYSTVADVYSNNGLTLIPSNKTKKINKLRSHILDIEASGGTNMGDALRRAKEILDNGNVDASKYIVFMTDGEPTGFSYTSATTVPVGDGYAAGMVADSEGKRVKNVASIHVENTDFYYGTGATPHSFANYSYEDFNQDGDFGGYAEKYARRYSNRIKTSVTGYDNYYISFSSTAAKNKLSTLAIYAEATSKDATTGDGINAVYDQIATEITTDLYLDNLRFHEVIPPDFKIIQTPEIIDVHGQSLSATFDDVHYILNTEGTHYIAEPIAFSIVLEVAKIGELLLGKNKTAGIHYIDIDGKQKHKFFEQIVIEVVDGGLMSNELKVLELQPGQQYELNRGMIQERFPDSTVILEQLAMSEFIGRIDEVNGQYDIVYIGAIESYKDYRYYSNNKSLKADIDITNKKARQVIEFVNSGQLLIMDKDLFNYNGSKIKSNFTTVRSLENVHEVKKVNDDFLDNIKAWYDTSNKRPDLTVDIEPMTYDGSKASMLPDHRLNYVYNAYSYNESTMLTTLYLDINGDGLYSTDEVAKVDSVNGNIAGVSMYINYESGFNGGLSWKLELKDVMTGTKDYKTGFVVMKGDKTVVNVLNLIPTEGSLDFDQAGFKAALATDDYEINVTRMHVDEFEANYPEPIGDKATALNGYYDMIIFGFGDSYENKDITDQVVLDAIKEFIATGQSVMFTHDLAGPRDASVNDGIGFYDDAPIITENFRRDMGFTDNRTEAGRIPHNNWKAWDTRSAYKQNDGLITMYPYVLANNTQKTLSIALTHDQYWKIDLESESVVPWFNLNNGDLKYYPEAYYYTFTNGTITYSGTGHSTPKGRAEQELFVNTMLKASRGANHAPTIEVEDVYDDMNVLPSDLTLPFKLRINDSDVTDQEFTTDFYYIIDDVETLVYEKDDIEKDILTDIELPKVLDESVREFVLKIVVTDPHGAMAIEMYRLTHVEVPMLDVLDNAEEGYLLGDVIDLQYIIDTVKEDELQKQLITNIAITSTLDSAFLSVPYNGYDGFIKAGSTYTMNPMFDIEATVGIDETDVERQLTMEAEKVGDTVITLHGTYDRRFSVNQVEPDEIEYYKEIPLGIKQGNINVQAVSDWGKPLGDVLVEIYDSNGNPVSVDNPDTPDVVEEGTSAETGTLLVEKLKTDIYKVVITAPVEGADPIVMEQIIDLKYSDNDQDALFEVSDTVPPIIHLQPDVVGLIIRDGEGASNVNTMDVHVHFDGVSSPLVITDVKKVSDSYSSTTGMSEGEFLVAPSSSEVLTEDSEEPFSYNDPLQDPAHPDHGTLSDYDKGKEKLAQFTINDNGTYAVYATNEAGNSVVAIIKINLFVDSIPDIL